MLALIVWSRPACERKLTRSARAAPAASSSATAGAEQLDVGVAEAVDRLEFVAHGEVVVAVTAATISS